MKKILIILALGTGAVAALVWLAVWLSLPGRPAQTVFSVASGESVDRIVGHLAEGGFIRSRLIFKFILKQSGEAGRLQPGQHDLAGVATYADIIARLTAVSLPPDEFILLIKEGWDLRDVRRQLEALGYARAAELYAVTGSPPGVAIQPAVDFSADFPFLKNHPAGISLEGYLFPDTYRIYKASSPTDLVRRLLDNFGQKTAPLAGEIAASGHSLSEILTMASVIEQEVRSDADRRIVSDIFWRRLAAGIPLQADSTVNYATGKSLAAVTGGDIGIDSRYNTYKYAGLPPGPIGNPGLSAIRAALEPQHNNYWFFLTDRDGNVHYARNLQEHAANRAKYLAK